MARATSPRRGARRLAPRRLGSGRRARADAEARRHARLSPGRPRARLSERPAHELRPRGSRTGSSKVLQTPFEVGPDFTYEESLVSRVDFTRRRPFTLTYHIHPAARWSDGVPVTAQDFIFTLRAIRRHGTPELRDLHAPVRSARAVDRKTVRVVLRPRSASWRDFFGNILPSHALRGSDLTQVWSDRIDDPRTGRPIGSGPFLVERLERGRAARPSPQPPLLGAAPSLRRAARHQIRAVGYRSQRGAEERRARRRHGRSTSGRPGRSSAAGGALGRARKHRLRAARRPARAERSPGAPQQARSPRARIRDRPHRARPTDTRRDRPLRSRARQRRAPDPEPLLRAELERVPLSTGGGPPPARASRLPQRSGRDLLLRRGAALVALRDDRRGSDSSAGAPPDTGAASGCGGRGRAGVRSPRGVLRPDPPAGGVRRRTLLVGRLTGWIVGRRLRLRRVAELHRVLPAARHRPPQPGRQDRSTSVDTPVSSTEPTGGSRSDVPTIPLYQFVFTAAYDTSVRNFVVPPLEPVLERGELVARGVALAAAIAVSLLAVSGAGGAPAQTPKRGGTLVSSRPIQSSRPASIPGVRRLGFDPAIYPGSRRRVRGRPRPRRAAEPRLARGHREEAVQADVPHPAGSALERRGTGQRLRLRVHPREVLRAARGPTRHLRQGPSVACSTRRRSRSCFESRYADWRRQLYNVVLPRHALAGLDITKVWSDRIDNPKTGGRIGSGPFLVESWERGKQLTLVRNPRYWGPHTAYLDRFVAQLRSRRTRSIRSRRSGARSSTSLALGGSFVSADIAREVRKLPGWRVARLADDGDGALRVPRRPGRAPRAPAQGRASSARVRHRPRGHRARDSGGGRRIYPPPLDSAVFLPTEPSTGRNWSGYRYDVARARRLLAQAGCRRGADGIYSCAGERLRLRFVTTAGDPVRERVVELARAQLRRVGVEVEPVYAPRGALLRPDRSRAAISTPCSSAGWASAGSSGRKSWCGHEQNWAGYCSRLTTRDIQQVNRIVDPAQRARVLNPADAKLAGRVPALPVVQPVLRTCRQGVAPRLHPGGSQVRVLAELGGLVARGVALAAALAVSLLAVSGAGGAPAQTPKRGGTRRRWRRRASRGASTLTSCDASSSLRRQAPHGPRSRGAFRSRRARLTRTGPDLVSRVEYTTTPPYTLTYHIRPEAHWSDGVPVTARDFEFTYERASAQSRRRCGSRMRVLRGSRSVTAVDAKTVEWFFAPVLPAGAGSSRASCLRMRSEERTSRRSGSTESATRRRAERSEAAPSSSSTGSTGAPRRSFATLATGEPSGVPRPARAPLLPGVGASAPSRSSGCRHGRGRRRHRVQHRAHRTIQALRSIAGPGCCRTRGELGAPRRPDRHRRHPSLKRKLVRQALAYGIDRIALARTLNGQIEARYPPSDSAMFIYTEQRYYRPNWQPYRSGRRRRGGCSSGRVAAGSRRDLRVRRDDGCRSASRPSTEARAVTQALELIQRQLRQVGIEIVPVYAPPKVLFNEILPGGNFDLAPFSYLDTRTQAGESWAVRVRRVQNYAGYCQRLVTSGPRPGTPNPRLRADRRCAEPSRREAGEGRTGDPAVREPGRAARRTSPERSYHRALDPFVGAEDWWLAE